MRRPLHILCAAVVLLLGLVEAGGVAWQSRGLDAAGTTAPHLTRRLEDEGGCGAYDDSASVSNQTALQSAIDGSGSICIEITADIDLVDDYDGTTALGVASGKNVRLWTSDDAILNGQGSARILIVASGAVVKLEGLTFYNGYVSMIEPPLL